MSDGQVNAVLGDLRELHNTFVFGAELQIPLTDRLAIFGQGNFITPASSGTVDSYLGFVYYPHGGARRHSNPPLLRCKPWLLRPILRSTYEDRVPRLDPTI